MTLAYFCFLVSFKYRKLLPEAIDDMVFMTFFVFKSKIQSIGLVCLRMHLKFMAKSDLSSVSSTLMDPVGSSDL